MTRRERIEARLERRRTWAASRDAKSTAAFDAAHKIADGIPLGQPILVGHHSEKRARKDADRIHNSMSRGVESAKMADLHRSKAGNIAGALESSIYSDDPDAIEALTAKAAGLRAEAERAKAINKEIKKGAGWTDRLAAKGITLTDKERETLLNIAKYTPYHCDKKTGLPVFPGYHITSLGANARRAEERIKIIEARNAKAARAEAAPDGVLVEELGTSEYSNVTYARVTFAEKPDRKIIDALKAAGYSWSNGSWVGDSAKLPAGVAPGQS